MEDDWVMVMCYRGCHQRGTLLNTKSHISIGKCVPPFGVFVPLPQNLRHNVSDDNFGGGSQVARPSKAGHPLENLSRRRVSNVLHKKRGQRKTSV